MKQSRYFAVVYMFVLTAVLSSMLIGLERLTRRQVKTNEQIAFERAVLAVFPQIEIKSAAEIHPVFTRDFVLSDSGAYEYRPSGQLAGYVLPFEGPGFWAPIKGVVGIGMDQKTMTGIRFYEQAETPGLGARIVEPFFYEQFAEKSLTEGSRPVRIRPPSEAGGNDISAITGATQTCVRLEKLLNEAVVQWRVKLQEQGK
ncbi:MAG: FMN-binding protein [Planctomycetes bacterium]|nr:FMN-binding protein [Planctomycetota bacterium]